MKKKKAQIIDINSGGYWRYENCGIIIAISQKSQGEKLTSAQINFMLDVAKAEIMRQSEL